MIRRPRAKQDEDPVNKFPQEAWAKASLSKSKADACLGKLLSIPKYKV